MNEVKEETDIIKHNLYLVLEFEYLRISQSAFATYRHTISQPETIWRQNNKN